MKIITSMRFLIFTLLFTITGFSQNEKIDSLMLELQNHQQKDTVRVQILNYLAFCHYRNDPPKSLEFIEQGAKLANELNFVSGIAHNIYVKAIFDMEQGNYRASKENLEKALQIYQSINDLKSIAKCKNTYGVLYYYQGKNEQALKYYQEALKLKEKLGEKNNDGLMSNIGNIYLDNGQHQEALASFEKALLISKTKNDPHSILNNLNAIAQVYYYKGSYPLALKYHSESLEVAKKANDSIGIFQSYNNTGNVYRMQDQNDKALNYYNKALSIKSAQYNVKNITAIKNNIAGIYYEIEAYDTAIVFYNESIILSREVGDFINLIDALSGLGFTYFEMKKYPKALSCFKESGSMALENNQQYRLLDSYHGLADTYFGMKNYDLALINTKELARLSKEYELLIHQKNAHYLLSKIYKKRGQFKKSLENHELFKTLNDSLFNKENVEKIANLEYEYKYKQKLDSANIRELNLTQTIKTTSEDLEKSQKNFLRIIIGFLLVFILLGSIIAYLRFRNIKSKTQNIVMEQKLLRSQMTPHFVFNSLSVLQGMILNKEEKKSVTYLSKFSNLLRIILENSREKTVSLSQELNAIENYLALQNLESGNYQYSIFVEEHVDDLHFEIPAMLIQPFAENSIEHAFPDSIANKKIEIYINYINKKLVCTITDNGIGINSQKQILRKDKKSLATTITTERLKMLSKDFKINGSVSIEDRQRFNEQGTIVTLEIPYKLHK